MMKPLHGREVTASDCRSQESGLESSWRWDSGDDCIVCFIAWSLPLSSSNHLIMTYGKCPKILNIKVSGKITYANSADPDQTALKEQSDQGLHCLPFH